MTPKVLNPQDQQERENQILDTALSVIKNQGINALTLDLLAKKLPFSKGTIYNHFTCKEDVLLALCNRGMEILADMFQRAAQFTGNNREKALAIHYAYMLYAKLYPTNFLLVVTAMSAGINEKASSQQQEIHQQLENLVIGPIICVIKTAIDTGECNPPIPMSLQQMAFACWSFGFGTNALLMEDVEHCDARSQLTHEVELINNANLLYDGMRWQPLSYEHNWNETLNRLRAEIFAPELEQLQVAETPLPSEKNNKNPHN